jgi:hypothetical protein
MTELTRYGHVGGACLRRDLVFPRRARRLTGKRPEERLRRAITAVLIAAAASMVVQALA